MSFSSRPGFRVAALAAIAAVAFAGLVTTARAATIIDDWRTVQVPPPPALTPVTVDPKTTALLVFDFLRQTCNDQVRPRCVASVPVVARLLSRARASGTTVIYSVIPGPATIADTLPQLAPQGNEPIVKSGPDKFIGTNLEQLLKDRGIKTVIVTGTAAHGVVLFTASHAALLGFTAVVPVDGMSSEMPYEEQYVAWNLVHAPVLSANVKLTAIDLISF